MADGKDLQPGNFAEEVNGSPQDQSFVGRRQFKPTDAYRNWITRARPARLPETPLSQSGGGDRVGIDRSLYSFKGYQEWTRKVRRDLEDEE